MTKAAGRKYYRRCGKCGSRHEQSEMVRDNAKRVASNGYACKDCWNGSGRSRGQSFRKGSRDFGKSVPRCCECSAPLRGEHFEYNGSTYCEECFPFDTFYDDFDFED